MLETISQGVNVHSELTQLIGELSAVYEVVLNSLPHLLQPISTYQAFLQTTGRYVTWPVT